MLQTNWIYHKNVMKEMTCLNNLNVPFQWYFYFIRYRPGSIPVAFVQAQLGYSSIEKEDWDSFVEPFSLSYADPEKTKIDCKASAASLQLIKWFNRSWSMIFSTPTLKLDNNFRLDSQKCWKAFFIFAVSSLLLPIT